MWLSAIRRFVALLTAVAFVASMQMAAMPAATASSAMSVVMGADLAAGKSNPGDCDQQTMTAGECIAICGSLQPLADQGVSLAFLPAGSAWGWLTETLSTTGVMPDHAPPRS
jgi:hypothetical protein